MNSRPAHCVGGQETTKKREKRKKFHRVAFLAHIKSQPMWHCGSCALLYTFNRFSRTKNSSLYSFGPWCHSEDFNCFMTLEVFPIALWRSSSAMHHRRWFHLRSCSILGRLSVELLWSSLVLIAYTLLYCECNLSMSVKRNIYWRKLKFWCCENNLHKFDYEFWRWRSMENAKDQWQILEGTSRSFRKLKFKS